MKIEKIDLSQERQIIIMMITNTQFLQQIIPILKIRLFKSSYAKIIAKWVLDYYNEFKVAPGKDIQNIYQSNIVTLKNEEDTELIANVLTSLSKDYENNNINIHNIDYLIKDSIRYLKLSSLELLKNDIENCILKGETNIAEQKIADYSRIEKPVNKGIRLLYDYESIAKAFIDQEETIFTFPGVLGEVCGPFLRGDLVSFLAAAKRGKSIIGSSLIRLESGNVETIENIVKNKKEIEVVSLNENTLKFENKKIIDFINCGKKDVYEIKLVGGRKIICAKTHPFLTFNGWKKLKDLRIGNKIANIDVFSFLSWNKIKSIKYKGKEECYDLTIDGNHNYIANGIVSHNSWWQWALAYMSMFCGLRVIFFSLEMTENQIKRRAWQSLVAQPRKDMVVEIPEFVENECGKYKWSIETKKEKRKGIDIKDIEKKQKQFRMITRGGDVWIKVIPAGSVSIDDLIIEIDIMKYYNNYVPDVIIIDYADILKPSKNIERKELRHQLDYTWKTMRGLAQDRNILVVTASQTSRAGFAKDASEELCAEDIRKITHVAKMIAINRNKEDNENSVVRIQQLAERDGKTNYRQVAVLNCLDIGRPYIDSRYADEVEK